MAPRAIGLKMVGLPGITAETAPLESHQRLVRVLTEHPKRPGWCVAAPFAQHTGTSSGLGFEPWLYNWTPTRQSPRKQIVAPTATDVTPTGRRMWRTTSPLNCTTALPLNTCLRTVYIDIARFI